MKVWSWVAAAAALMAVGGVAGFGVAAHEQLSALEHGPAFALPTPVPVLAPAQPAPIEQGLLDDALLTAAQSPSLGDFHARVSDASGNVVFEQFADVPLRPASTTKVLTAAAAILTLGADDTVKTPVYRVGNDVVVEATGDVWFTAERLDALAAELSQLGPTDAVFIDTSAWASLPELAPGWNPVDIDGGYVAPMQPAMINGGRGVEDETGDVPRSHTPALDVARALADRLGAPVADYGAAPTGVEPVVVAESPTLVERLSVMMKNSDNVYAEAIGRETPGDALAILAEHGFDTSNCTIADSSGLSTDNLITPALLDAILSDAATHEPLRPLLATLPVANAEGTLVYRYGDLPGRGWVRAKTGTLDDTSALAGTVTSENGNVYTFAFISNGSNILDARRGMDEMASVLRGF